MKKVSVALLAVFLSVAQAGTDSFKAPDIVLDTKLDYNWTGFLVNKFRSLCNRYRLDDPFSGKFDEPILLNESQVGTLLPEDSKELLRDFGNAIGLNLIKAQTRVAMHGFSYEVKGFHTDLKASEQTTDGLVIGNEFSASEVSLSADKISFALVIPGKNSSPVLNVNILRPVIKASEENLINVFTKIKILDVKDSYKLQIMKASFEDMATGLVSHAADIAFDYADVEIPRVSVKIGTKTVTISPQKVKQLLRDNHEAIKGILLAQAADVLRSSTSEAAFKLLEQYRIQKEYWVGSPILKSQILIGKIASASGHNLELNIPADFCTSEKFNLLKRDCINNRTTQTANSRITSTIHKESVELMKNMMERGEASIIASISEDYLNKLLATTYDAGLWKRSLDEAGVKLGPNRVIMRLDKKGESGTLIMDVVYRPTKMEKLLTGSNEIRFPLVLDLSLRIEKQDGIPEVIVRFDEVDTSDETIINGRPQDNMVSTVKEVKRFKGKVAKAIRERIGSLRNTEVFRLKYPELKGVGLDKIEFMSDGLGRMNAFIRLDDFLRDPE